jgi:competence protein ComFC
MFRKILKLFFPLKCIGCGKKGQDICEKCYGLLNKMAKFRHRSKVRNHSYEEIVFCFDYRLNIVRRLICCFKFQGVKDFGFILGDYLAETLKGYVFDFVVPVPISKSRLLERGFNQSSILAKRIVGRGEGRFLNCLSRSGNSPPQSKSTRNMRLKNLKGQIQLKENLSEAILNSSIVLIDDVITTGSTVEECSRILKDAGAKKITVAVLARTEAFC